MNDQNNALPRGEVLAERSGSAGLVTLNRPKALNALSLSMVRDLTRALLAFRDDEGVKVVAIRGTNKKGEPGSPESFFGSFCAGGDIRFFHEAALAGDTALEDFFTDEYSLNHLIQTYPKPFVAFMDGIVMGGGMGLSQGAALRIVTEHTKMAMPETNIGLFPDVGGGYFLSRCPGHAGEYLALTGEVINADEAIRFGLADVKCPAADLPAIWQELATQAFSSTDAARQWLASELPVDAARGKADTQAMDRYFSLQGVQQIVDALEQAAGDEWAASVAGVLRKRSPLMLHVTLEQVRRARAMTLADDLRMERDMVYQCFHLRPGTASETVEGIRALAVDKDHQPRWNPARVEDVTPAMAQAFFASPWPAASHPLKKLA